MACLCSRLRKPCSCRKFSPGKYLSPPRGESWWPHVSPLQSRQPGLGMLGGLDGWGLSGKSRTNWANTHLSTPAGHLAKGAEML